MHPGQFVFYATSSGEKAYEDKSKGLGYFTRVFIDVLSKDEMIAMQHHTILGNVSALVHEYAVSRQEQQICEYLGTKMPDFVFRPRPSVVRKTQELYIQAMEDGKKFSADVVVKYFKERPHEVLTNGLNVNEFNSVPYSHLMIDDIAGAAVKISTFPLKAETSFGSISQGG